MPFPDLNNDGKTDGDDAFIYEEILEKGRSKKNPPRSGCCVVLLLTGSSFLAIVLRVWL